MNGSRRGFVRSLCRSALVFSFDQIARVLPAKDSALGVQFINVAREAGLNKKTVFGGESATAICSKPPAAASPFSISMATAGSTSSW